MEIYTYAESTKNKMFWVSLYAKTRKLDYIVSISFPILNFYESLIIQLIL
jgi:hypothetical protein